MVTSPSITPPTARSHELFACLIAVRFPTLSVELPSIEIEGLLYKSLRIWYCFLATKYSNACVWKRMYYFSRFQSFSRSQSEPRMWCRRVSINPGRTVWCKWSTNRLCWLKIVHWIWKQWRGTKLLSYTLSFPDFWMRQTIQNILFISPEKSSQIITRLH